MNLFHKANLKVIAIVFSFIILITSCSKDDNKRESMSIDNIKFETFTDSRDQHVYKTIKIGNQTWMAENLAYLPTVYPTNNVSTTQARYYIYANNGTNISTAKSLKNYISFGVLYNWPAALSACPTGWHLPTADEWDVLENYLTNNGYGYEGTGDDIAKSMALNSIWNYFSLDGTIGHETTNNNKSGFSALPAGGFSGFGDFFGINECTYMWTSTQKDVKYAWFRNLEDHSSVLGGSVVVKNNGYSVRCIKD